jgi:hypothetical protein
MREEEGEKKKEQENEFVEGDDEVEEVSGVRGVAVSGCSGHFKGSP